MVGAGFGGLGAARALRDAGFDEVVVLERADSVGGVWRDNTYPHAACDVPSPLYSWSWAPNPGWARRYASQPEILAYLRDAAAHEGLLDLVRTGQQVSAIELDQTAGGWRVRTAAGRTFEADLVVTAVGQLSNPVVPAVPGAEDFAGPAFHSARWRHDVDLRGRRVAVVGTGASTIQLVPGIVDEVAQALVFQRSAPYVVPKPDQSYGPRYRRMFARHPRALAAERRLTFLLSEQLNAALAGGARARRARLAVLRAVWWSHLRRAVRDPALRASLRPTYPIGCKRILFSNDWYPALRRDHVTVVTEAVSRIEPTGLRTADGRLHEADVLIWGTGFAATRFLDGIRVTGVDGADLHARWAGGARAHLGLSVPGFPNLFCLYGPNTNLGELDHRHAGGPGRVRRRGGPPRRGRARGGPDRAGRGAPRGVRGVRPRGAAAARHQCLVGLRELVHRRRPDHHQLAGHRQGVPAAPGSGRLARPRAVTRSYFFCGGGTHPHQSNDLRARRSRPRPADQRARGAPGLSRRSAGGAGRRRTSAPRTPRSAAPRRRPGP